jgi:radical SAM additional 4Fe4S-binding domain
MDNYTKKEVHIFSLEDRKYLFEVNTLKVYEIDELTERILAGSKSFSLEGILDRFAGEYEPEELTDLFHTLVDLNVLIKDDKELAENPEAPGKNENPGLSTLVLNISQKCNMNCDYCYADGGTYNAPEQMMDRKTGEACVDFLLAPSAEKTCHIFFFGGEPLLNPDVMMHIVEYAKSQASIMGRELQFGITTNGTLLNDRILKCFVDNGFSVMLSLDGPKNLQDSQRTLKNGEGSYDIIALHLKKLISQKGLNVGCRSTITPKNLQLHMIDKHFTDLGVRYYHIEPATFGPYTWDTGSTLKKQEMQAYFTQYGDLVKSIWKKINNREFVTYRAILREVMMIDQRTLKKLPCGMGSKSLSISADGNIYTCYRLIGMKEQILGSVLDPNINESIKKYTPINIEEKAGCAACWARNICAGDCPAESIIVNNDERKPVSRRCTIRQNRIEWAIWLYSNIKGQSDKSFAEKLLSNEFYYSGNYQ